MPRATILALSLAAACCTPSIQDLSTFRLQSPTSLLESQGLDEVLVASYSSGQILGSGSLCEMEVGFQSMVEPRVPQDHPLLGLWQDHLERLQSLARDPQASVGELVWLGSELPFQAAADDAVIAHVGEDPIRAALALDLGDRLGISRTAELRVLDVALQNPVLEDDRVAEWMRHFTRNNNHVALRDVARSPHCGEYTAVAGVLGLDKLATDDRTELYGLLAPHLAGRPERADFLVGHLALLPRERRGAAARRLVSSPDGSPRLHLAVTVRLDELPQLDRLGILMEVVRGPRFAGDVQLACIEAAQAMADPESQVALDEITRSSRLEPEARELLIR